MKQLTLSDIEIQEKQARIKVIAAELDKLYKGVALSMDRPHFATLIDKSYTYVNDILNTNNEEGQKPFQAYMIAALIVETPKLFTEMVLSYINNLCNLKAPEKRSELTPEEELKFIKNKIKAHGLEPLFKEKV